MFVVAFPVAPLFALLNNIVEIRLDAKKYTGKDLILADRIVELDNAAMYSGRDGMGRVWGVWGGCGRLWRGFWAGLVESVCRLRTVKTEERGENVRRVWWIRVWGECEEGVVSVSVGKMWGGCGECERGENVRRVWWVWVWGKCEEGVVSVSVGKIWGGCGECECGENARRVWVWENARRVWWVWGKCEVSVGKMRGGCGECECGKNVGCASWFEKGGSDMFTGPLGRIVVD